MIRMLLCTTALLAAAPALAQQADPAAQTAVPAQDQAAQDPAAQSPAGQAPAAQAQPAEASATNVAAVVESEFPTYDADKSGSLSKAEFAKWMTALKKEEVKSTGETLSDSKIAAWANGAFASADKDKNRKVSKAELIGYLGGGA